MLIGFIGCPCSGKTTTAAKAFADLKELGLSAEFIPEQARLHIAEQRVILGLTPRDSIHLSDWDQQLILHRQLEYEDTLLKACGSEVIVIADSSCLNTLLYMSPEARESVKDLIHEKITRYDHLFYCFPVKPPPSLDPNRIHNPEESLAVDRQIPEVLRSYAPGVDPVFLMGDAKQRHHEVTRSILEHLAR